MKIKKFFDDDERWHALVPSPKGVKAVEIPMDFDDLLALAGIANLTDEQFVKMRERLAAVREAVDDTAFLESQVRERLAFGVRRKAEEPSD